MKSVDERFEFEWWSKQEDEKKGNSGATQRVHGHKVTADGKTKAWSGARRSQPKNITRGWKQTWSTLQSWNSSKKVLSSSCMKLIANLKHTCMRTHTPHLNFCLFNGLAFNDRPCQETYAVEI